jgi:NTP pyrophosphatase (non-canonical NTP hydrolase)
MEPTQKEIIIGQILNILFQDELCKVTNELTEFKMEFSRPPIAQSMYNRFLITWNPAGEFKIFGLVGRERPVQIAVNNWEKIGKYLKENYIHVEQHLKIITNKTRKTMANEQKIINEIVEEVKRAETKHPHWPDNPIEAAAITCEESGELIRAALQLKYEGGDKESVRKEAIQTAATCIRLLKNL